MVRIPTTRAVRDTFMAGRDTFMAGRDITSNNIGLVLTQSRTWMISTLCKGVVSPILGDPAYSSPHIICTYRPSMAASVSSLPKHCIGIH